MAKRAAKAKEAPVENPGQELQTVNTNNEVAEIETMTPEQYEVALQEKISSEIKKYNVTDAKLAELKEKYTGITVKGPDDKEGLALLKEALTTLTKVRTGADKKRKQLSEDYRKMVDGINKEGNRIIEAVKEIEAPLKEEDQRIKQEIEEQRLREEKEAQRKLDERVNKIKEAGMVFDGSFYSIANMSMDISTLKQMSDSDFLFLVAKVEMEATRIRKEEEEAARIEQERLEAERIEREKFEAQQAELRRQQEEFEAKQKAFARQQEEFAGQQRKAAQEQEERERAIVREKIFSRDKELVAMQFVFDRSANLYFYQNEGGKFTIDAATLSTASPEYWLDLLTRASKEIAMFDQKQREIDQQREEEQEAIRIKQEEDRRIAWEQEQEQKRQAEEAERLRLEEEKAAREKARQDQLPDLHKVNEYLQAIRGIQQPEVSTDDAVLTMQALNHFLDEIQKSLEEEINAPGE